MPQAPQQQPQSDAEELRVHGRVRVQLLQQRLRQPRHVAPWHAVREPRQREEVGRAAVAGSRQGTWAASLVGPRAVNGYATGPTIGPIGGDPWLKEVVRRLNARLKWLDKTLDA